MSYEINEEMFREEEDDNDVIELDGSEENISKNDKKGKLKRRRTSNVWSFFDMLPTPPGEKARAKCKYCSHTYLAPSQYGTGNLKRHMEVCTIRDTRDIGQMFLDQNKKSSSVSASNSKFESEKFRELLISAVIMHDLPFRFVEYTGIRAVLQYLRSDVPLISRNTAKADLVKMHQREKQRVKCMLSASPGRISLTSDLWTSIITDGYMCLTAHFLDKNWVLQKRVMNFSFMPPPHNGISLSEKIYKLLCEWGILNKVFSITLDNASSNDVSVDLLRSQLNMKKALVCEGEFFHLHCCAHILNLIVQDGLKEIDSSIQKVRESVKYVKGSQGRKQKFLECVNHMSLDGRRGLRQDVPTRWNSTYIMLDSAIYYRRAFCHLELTDSNFKHCLTTSEWDKVEKIKSFLACFYKATCDFSGTKYLTANLYFPAIFMIYVKLKQQSESGDEYKRSMANQMLSKFEKYWSEFSVVLAIAVILDPRYKLQFIEFCYKKLYGVSNSIEYLNVRGKLFSLFIEYEGTTPTTSSMSVEKSYDQCLREVQEYPPEATEMMKEFDLYEKDDISAQKSQSELYLDEPRMERSAKLDILAFWKVNQFRYPEVSSMARDILSIPISTVASESTFSVGGRVIDQFRSSLKPDIVEALVCTRDWLYGEQYQTQMTLDELAKDVVAMDNSFESNLDIPVSSGAYSANVY